MSRNGKLVVRPDTGNPVKIIAGDPEARPGSPEHKGAAQILYEVFGGTKNAAGYIELDPHIGLIYGDSITPDIQDNMLKRLMQNGFASSNVVLGFGSYNYQYVTRDTFSFAIKATYVEINGEPRDIYKKPKTDLMKSSHRGLMHVYHDGNKYMVKYPATKQEEASGCLTTVFRNGEIVVDHTLTNIRERIEQNLRTKLR